MVGDSRAAREKSTRVGVLRRHVGVRRLSATLINTCLKQAVGIEVFFSSLLEHPTISEAEVLVMADDDMIQDTNPHRLADIF